MHATQTVLFRSLSMLFVLLGIITRIKAVRAVVLRELSTEQLTTFIRVLEDIRSTGLAGTDADHTVMLTLYDLLPQLHRAVQERTFSLRGTP